jgi:hypothetical protein
MREQVLFERKSILKTQHNSVPKVFLFHSHLLPQHRGRTPTADADFSRGHGSLAASVRDSAQQAVQPPLARSRAWSAVPNPLLHTGYTPPLGPPPQGLGAAAPQEYVMRFLNCVFVTLCTGSLLPQLTSPLPPPPRPQRWITATSRYFYHRLQNF